MKNSDNYVDISSFLEEMVGLIDERMKKQEAAIARVQSELKGFKKSMETDEKGKKIDKSVLKILRQ